MFFDWGYSDTGRLMEMRSAVFGIKILILFYVSLDTTISLIVTSKAFSLMDLESF